MSQANTAHDIRPARFGDAQEITRLSVELGYPATLDGTMANLEVLLHSPRYRVAVAPAPDGALFGWIVAERRLCLESGEAVEITGLVVSNSARRRGVGSALVAAAERWAMTQGFRSLRVRSNVSRTESHPFYQGIGFVPKKTQHTYEKPLVPGGR